MERFGVYVHVPWCRVRCPYCAFVTYSGDPAWDTWLVGVLRDWHVCAPHFQGTAHSVFFGGGTPSLAPPAVLRDVLAALPLEAAAEVTVEANPGTLDDARLPALRDAGVTRLSLGVQTFDPRFARLLNRAHTVEDSRDLCARVRGTGFVSWSVDVMFGLPDQTPNDFRVDLEAILEAGPPHVSLYGLTIEEGTAFARGVARGRLRPADDDDWAQMLDDAVATLGRAGYERYEISNFARPGHRSVHNSRVWAGDHYAGLGPAAEGYWPDGRRTRGASTLDAWAAEPYAHSEWPSPLQEATDLVLGMLRRSEGVDRDLLARRTGMAVDTARLRHAMVAGLLTEDIALTENGRSLADAVTAKVCDALVPRKIATGAP